MREKRRKRHERRDNSQRDSSWIAELFEAIGDVVSDFIEALLK